MITKNITLTDEGMAWITTNGPQTVRVGEGASATVSVVNGQAVVSVELLDEWCDLVAQSAPGWVSGWAKTE